MAWLIGFGVNVHEILRVEISKKLLSQQKNRNRNPVFLRVDTVSMIVQDPKIHSVFQKSLNLFQIDLIISLKSWLIFCCHQLKIRKLAIFDILMTITLGENIITSQMTLVFSSTLWALSVDIFHFNISIDALRDLVPFEQFKKREKYPWRTVTFSKVTCFNLQLY